MIVTYMINASGIIIEKVFDSPYRAKLLVNKLRHSKTCTFISCRGF